MKSSLLKIILVLAVMAVGIATIYLAITTFNQARSHKQPPASNASQTNSSNQKASLESTIKTNATSTNTLQSQATATNAPGSAVSTNALTGKPGSPTNAPDGRPKTADSAAPAEEIQLSFQGANIELIVQWLAKTTGKSVVKHPRVQCQLTIMSSKKISQREAINLVYRALAMEGFNTVEASKAIFIVPEGQDPKISPELLDAAKGEVPEGRQKFVRFFPLKHAQAADIKEKVRGMLSEKAAIEVDTRANQLIVTDYNDNIRLLGDLIKELDVTTISDSVIEIYPLKYLDAADLASMLALVLNTSSSSGAPSGRPGPPPGGPVSSDMPVIASSATSTAPSLRFWPDKTMNRLIVVGPKSKIPEVEKLIQLLDTEKAKDMTVRVIQLKNVNAEDLVKEISPLYQKLSVKSPKDTVEITANNRSNTLIILSNESNYKALEKLIASLDTEDAQEKVMQAFPLKNADAEDVAKQLQQLNQEQDSAFSRYLYYYSDSPRGGGKKMSFVADRRRNTVVVQAPPSMMDKVAKMVNALDAPVTDNSLAPKIFPLKYVSANDIEQVLNELFLKKQQTRFYWDYYDEPMDTAERNVGRLYGKVRITSEPYANALIVTANSPENLAAVEEVLKQLDKPSEAGETTFRVNLQFARATALANSINILFAKGGSPPLRATPQQGQPAENRTPQNQNSPSANNFGLEQEAKEDVYYPWLGGQQEGYRSFDSRSSTTRPVSDLVGRVRVVPDKRINSLLITCNVHFFPQVSKLINEMDAPTAQVLISAKIVEIGSDFRDKLGVRWSSDGSKSFTADDADGAILAQGTGTYRKVFAGNALAESLRSGILDSKVNLDILVQFLRKNTDATVMAEPQINIADNEIGKLFVGSQVPFLAGSMNTDVGGRNDSYQYRDVGVILEVTPHINNAEEVALKIRTESSSIRNGETLHGGAILDTRNFRTDLLVKSGQTVVLGGIIQREQQNIVRKVPILGSIPLLGYAFKKKDKVNREVELMVFLSPKVTRTPDEAKRLMEDVEKQTPRIKQWNEDNTEGVSINISPKEPPKSKKK